MAESPVVTHVAGPVRLAGVTREQRCALCSGLLWVRKEDLRGPWPAGERVEDSPSHGYTPAVVSPFGPPRAPWCVAAMEVE